MLKHDRMASGAALQNWREWILTAEGELLALVDERKREL